MSAAKVLCTLVVSLFCISTVAFASLPVSAATPDDPGVIAYVQRSTTNIHVISPDGTGDRLLWTAPASQYMPPAIDLAWRPDGRELAFTSTHENACSWYDSDIFSIGYNGAGYRRITNSPACAVLATLPQGAVTVNVNNYTSDLVWVYVAGAPSVKSILGDGIVTFDKVADFGSGVLQPSIGVWGLYRFVSYPPYADVQPGKTVPGGNITIMSLSGFQAFGAGKVSWKADGSALAYVLRSNSNIWEISANPAYGATGTALPFNEHTKPRLVAWGPTAAKQDEYLYVSDPNILDEGYAGIWLGTRGDASGGKRLVSIDSDATWVKDIEWLPDGSGFLFSLFYVGLGYFCNIFEYDFATGDATRLTDFPPDGDYAHGLSISPDGRHVVFERVVDDLDSDSSLWIMNIESRDVWKLVDDAGRPAWGQAPAPLKPSAYLPMLVR
ncbi:MAG: hypothetical protein ACM30E_01460 [Nitrososphaerales archaeon]